MEQASTAAELEHPRTVYVKDDVIVPRLDAWIATPFDEANLDATCEALATADAAADDESEVRAEAARRKIADCDRRLADTARS
jgi:hypothetical protein